MHADISNGTGAYPFVSGVGPGQGALQIYEGLLDTIAGAETPGDVETGLATVYSQTMMSIPAGVLERRLPLTQTRRIQTQVTRMPKAPFFCVILLDLLYAIIGMALTITALLVVILGRGIRDAQARLSMTAIIAESFESPALGDDAHAVDELFAQRRGLSSRRIALIRREEGGRRFKQIVDRAAPAGDRQSLTEMSHSTDGRL